LGLASAKSGLTRALSQVSAATDRPLHGGPVLADDSKLSNVGGNGFIWILLVAAGTFFVTHQVSLEGNRPATTERSIHERVGEQHVDARLWQDPFAAVADELNKSPELKPENCDRSNIRYKEIETYCRPPLGPPGGAPFLTLLVSVSGTPYSEDQEARRRRRYAVLAALNAEGFVPEDPQHIGFYWPDPEPPPPTSTAWLWASQPDSIAVQGTASAPASQSATLPKFIPYEWFKRRPERPKVQRGHQRVLLLWFDEDALAAPATPAPKFTASTQAVLAQAAHVSPPRAAPLQQLGKLLCPYLPRQEGSPDSVKILGPQLSTTLKAIVDEVDAPGWSKADWSSGACSGSPPPPFYGSQATVSDDILLTGLHAVYAINRACLVSNTCTSEFFEQEKGIRLHRITATDDALAGAIGEELKLRGVGRLSPIAGLYARFEDLVETVGGKLGLRGGEPDRHDQVAPASEWYARYEALVHKVGDTLGVRRHSHIALVSEWDTLYGRALPDTMARCLTQSPCEPVSDDPFRDKEWLHPFKYLRGLDGQMPDGSGSASGANARDTGSKPDKDSKDSAKRPPDPIAKDRAEGQSQFDYLRRLGDRIQQLDAALRRDGQQGIEAVGVLGSDLYDKLLVLQSLRPLLPNAWFFTTDLDALLLNPGGQTRTRNLLVASSFGLRLRPDIQNEIPPFRGSYQTAEFLVTRVAIRDDTPPQNPAPRPAWSVTPLIFEIGSTREFQFPKPGSAAMTEAQRSDRPDCTKNLLKCKDIHPLPSAMVPQVATGPALGLVALALGVVLALGLYIGLSFKSFRRRTWRRINMIMKGADNNQRLLARGLTCLAGLLLVLVILGALLYFGVPKLAHWLTRDGQPMMPLEGLSVWPTIFLRLATLLLCIWLLVRGWQRLERNTNKIVQDLHLTATWQNVADERASIIGVGPPWTRLLRYLGYRLPGNGAGQNGNAVHFWRRYIYRARWIARIGRVTIGIAAMAVLWAILALIFGHPHDPIRGQISLWTYNIVTFALILAILVLIFSVADATLLCWSLIKAFRKKGTGVWPARTLQEFSTRFDLPQACLDDWLDLVFVSKRTKCITSLFYYPFLIIALLVASRSPLFADYGRNIPDLIAMGVGMLIVTACAVALRWSVEESRAKARRRLNQQIILARNLNDGGHRAGQLEILLRRVDELREGAFSPFSQQPMVRAMLLPLGSLGGTALLQYLFLPGFS